MPIWTLAGIQASWREVIELCRWQALKPLVLITIRTLMSLYQAVLHAWYFPFTLLIGLVLPSPVLLCSFYVVFVLRAARPSVHFKDTTYWQHYCFVDWIIFFGVGFGAHLLAFALTFFSGPAEEVVRLVSSVLLRLSFLYHHSWIPGGEVLGRLLVIFMSPVLALWGLFLLDAQNPIRSALSSLWRAVTMLVYNYPIFLASYVVLRLLLVAGHLCYVLLMKLVTEQLAPECSLVGWLLLFALSLPVWLSFMTTIYVKRLHEQFSVYF